MSTKKNKPQWLIDAEKDIAKFEDSKYGKMSDSEVNQYIRNAKGGSISGTNNVDNKVFGTADSKAQKALNESGWYGSEKQIASSKLGGSIGGKISGKMNAESGHLDKIANHKTRSKGGKNSYQKHVESGWIHEYRKLGTEASVKSRKKKKFETRKVVFDMLPKQFIGKDLKKILIDLGDPYKEIQYKSYLKDEQFCIKIHQGSGNQFDPPIYEKINY